MSNGGQNSSHDIRKTSSSAIADTALQGGSVVTKNGRQYSADNIGLSSTTVM